MGRRWGKTVLGGCASLGVAATGGKAAWVVPEYKNGRPLWRFAESACGPIRAIGQARIDRGERTIEFANGGFLGIYTADNPDSIRGDWFSMVVLDEVGRIAEEAWQDAIEPTLADCDGDAILISTPKGRNWFWREWDAAMRDGDYAAAWQAPSSDNPNPRIHALMDRVRERSPERTFQQEWLALFVEDGGGVFRKVAEAATATPQKERQKTTTQTFDGPVDSWHEYVFGVDWGKSQDFTVISVIDLTLKQEVYLDRFNQIDYSFQRKRLEGINARFKPRVILAEKNAMGDPIIEELQRSGLPVQPFTTTNETKKEIIEGLALDLETSALAILPDATANSELLAFEVNRLPSGRLTYGAPSGMHDDTVIARALAASAARESTVTIGPNLWE